MRGKTLLIKGCGNRFPDRSPHERGELARMRDGLQITLCPSSPSPRSFAHTGKATYDVSMWLIPPPELEHSTAHCSTERLRVAFLKEIHSTVASKQNEAQWLVNHLMWLTPMNGWLITLSLMTRTDYISIPIYHTKQKRIIEYRLRVVVTEMLGSRCFLLPHCN